MTILSSADVLSMSLDTISNPTPKAAKPSLLIEEGEHFLVNSFGTTIFIGGPDEGKAAHKAFNDCQSNIKDLLRVDENGQQHVVLYTCY